MTQLKNGSIATDANTTTIQHYLGLGYTIRHIETWHDRNETIVVWDGAAISETDLPY